MGDPGLPLTGEGNTDEWAEAIRVAFEYRPLEGQQLRVKADEALDALLAECGRLREEAAEHLEWQKDALAEAEELRQQALRLREQLDAARQALEVYADPKHWAIRRNGTMYADCIWIGPGATDRVNPDGPGVARAAMAATRTRCPACYGDHGPDWKPADGCLALPPEHRSAARAALGVEGPAE